MPRIYKGTTPKIAVMFYPCIIDTDLLTNLTISLYTENTTDSIIIPMEEITLKDNIALFELPKYKLDMLGDGVVKYISEGAYNGDDFIFDRYSDYTIVTPVEYQPQDIYIQQIKYVTKAEYENLKTNGKLEENIYLISDATPQDNLKTINGESLVGEGDIKIETSVDLTDYYTKDETDNKYQSKGNYLTSIPEEYVTDSELTKKGYATEQWVEEQEYAPLSDVNYLTMVVSGKQSTITDLDEIRTGAELGKTAIQEIPSEYITETELNEAIANIDSGNNIVSSTIFLEVIGDFENKKILSDKVGYEEHNRAVYDRLYNIVNSENSSFSDETFFVNAEFEVNGLTSRMNGILSHNGEMIFSTFSIFMIKNINYSLWTDVELFMQNYIYNDPIEFVIDVAHIDYHNIATTKYVDEQLGNVNNILENIIG